MDLQVKAKILNEIKKMLNNEASVSDVKVADVKIGKQIEFLYAKDIKCSIISRTKDNVIIIRADAEFSVNEDMSLSILADDICKVNGCVNSIYENNAMFQKVISYSDDIKNEVANMVVMEIKKILDSLKANIKYFKHAEDMLEDVKEDKEYEEEIKDIEDNDKITETNEETKEEISENKEIKGIDEDLESLLKEIEEDEKIINSIEIPKVNNPKISEKLNFHQIKKNKNSESVENPTFIKQEKEKIKNFDKENISPNYDEFSDAPNVKEQMEKMYHEIDKLFNERKMQSEKREALLDEYAKAIEKKEHEISETLKKKEDDLLRKSIQMDDELRKKEEDIKKSYLQKEMNLDKIKAEYDEKSNNLYNEQHKLEFEKKKVEALRENLESEKASLIEKEKLINANVFSTNKEMGDINYEELNSSIEQLQSAIDLLENEKINITEIFEKKVENVVTTSKKKDEVIARLKERLNNKDEEITKLKENTSACDIDLNDGEITSLKEELEKANNIIKTLKEQNNTNTDIKAEIETVKNEKDQIQAMYEEERKEKEKALLQIQEIKDNPKPEKEILKEKAVKIKSEIEKIGIDLVYAPSNGDDVVLTGRKEECTICINVNLGIVYCEKKIKNVKKMQEFVAKMSMKDIRKSYYILYDESKIVCKYLYKDVSKGILEVLEEFKNII